MRGAIKCGLSDNKVHAAAPAAPVSLPCPTLPVKAQPTLAPARKPAHKPAPLGRLVKGLQRLTEMLRAKTATPSSSLSPTSLAALAGSHNGQHASPASRASKPCTQTAAPAAAISGTGTGTGTALGTNVSASSLPGASSPTQSLILSLSERRPSSSSASSVGSSQELQQQEHGAVVTVPISSTWPTTCTSDSGSGPQSQAASKTHGAAAAGTPLDRVPDIIPATFAYISKYGDVGALGCLREDDETRCPEWEALFDWNTGMAIVDDPVAHFRRNRRRRTSSHTPENGDSHGPSLSLNMVVSLLVWMLERVAPTRPGPIVTASIMVKVADHYWSFSIPSTSSQPAPTQWVDPEQLQVLALIAADFAGPDALTIGPALICELRRMRARFHLAYRAQSDALVMAAAANALLCLAPCDNRSSPEMLDFHIGALSSEEETIHSTFRCGQTCSIVRMLVG